MQTGERKHLGHIESLRAIAAILVLFFHLISFSDLQGYLVSSDALRSWSAFGAQGVELFYIISGYVIYFSFEQNGSYSMVQFPIYLLKRIARIFPPYWMTILLVCLVPVLFQWPFPYSVNQVAQNATFTVDLFQNAEWMNPIFVTLKVEFIFYLIIGVLAVPMCKNQRVFAGVILGSLTLSLLFPSVDIFHNAPYFLIGILLSQVYQKKELLQHGILLVICIGFIGIRYPMEDLVISVLGAIFLCWLPIRLRLLEWIGSFSYSLYLTHGLTGILFLSFCKSKTDLAFPIWVYLGFAVLISVLGAFVFYWVIEKRAMLWSKKIKY